MSGEQLAQVQGVTGAISGSSDSLISGGEDAAMAGNSDSAVAADSQSAPGTGHPADPPTEGSIIQFAEEPEMPLGGPEQDQLDSDAAEQLADTDVAASDEASEPHLAESDETIADETPESEAPIVEDSGPELLAQSEPSESPDSISSDLPATDTESAEAASSEAQLAQQPDPAPADFDPLEPPKSTGEIGERLTETYDRLLTAEPTQDHQKEAKKAGLEAIHLADEANLDGDASAADAYATLGETLADVALSATPGVGWAKDVYEATTGVSLVTGKPLTDMEWGFAVAGAVTGGLGSQFKNVSKAISALEKFEGAKDLAKTASKHVDDALAFSKRLLGNESGTVLTKGTDGAARLAHLETDALKQLRHSELIGNWHPQTTHAIANDALQRGGRIEDVHAVIAERRKANAVRRNALASGKSEAINVSEEATFRDHPTIGPQHTFMTDTKAVEDLIGKIPSDSSDIMKLSREQAAQLENILGKESGSLQQGGRFSVVTDISRMSQTRVTSGNDKYLGADIGLPGGGPEVKVPALPTDSTKAAQRGIRQIRFIVE